MKRIIAAIVLALAATAALAQDAYELRRRQLEFEVQLEQLRAERQRREEDAAFSNAVIRGLGGSAFGGRQPEREVVCDTYYRYNRTHTVCR